MIDIYAIPMYKGFRLLISENCRDNNYQCIAHKHPYYTETIDDHGKLHRTLHEAEMVEFIIDRSEFYDTDETETEVVIRRFTSEVEYYLNPKTAPDKSIKLLRKYKCSHCGTEVIVDTPGYTPTCCNCGALMVVDEGEYNDT